MPRDHHTDEEELDLTRTYAQTFHKKPLGLWYDIDCAWTKWCKDDDYGDGYNNSFLLDIKTDDMLIIDTPLKLIDFHREFSFVPDTLKNISGDVRLIAWSRLAEYCSGIEIAPYREEQSDLGGYFWYSRWDVASGCIWNLSQVNSARKVLIENESLKS